MLEPRQILVACGDNAVARFGNVGPDVVTRFDIVENDEPVRGFVEMIQGSTNFDVLVCGLFFRQIKAVGQLCQSCFDCDFGFGIDPPGDIIVFFIYVGVFDGDLAFADATKTVDDLVDGDIVVGLQGALQLI